MKKKNSSIAKWICLTLVLTLAGLLTPPPVSAAPAATCSYTAPCSVSPQLTDAQSCLLSTQGSRFAAADLSFSSLDFTTVVPLYNGHGGHHDRCRRARHECWERCNDSGNSHRCMRHCMDRRGCN